MRNDTFQTHTAEAQGLPARLGITNSSMRRGASLVEVLVGASIIVIFVVLLSSAYAFFVQTGARTMEHVSASFLLREGVEAVRTLRDESWSARIAPLAFDTEYYLHFNGDHWRTTTTPQTVDGTFTRWFTLDEVERDADDDIASVGSVDDGTRKVNMNVRWVEANATSTKSLRMYVMNLFDN